MLVEVSSVDTATSFFKGEKNKAHKSMLTIYLGLTKVHSNLHTAQFKHKV